MATKAYTTGLNEIMDGTIDWEDATDIYLALISNTTSYTFNPDHTYMDMGGANDPVDAETNVTGYTRGWGGAGRKQLASKTITADTANDRVTFDAADTGLSWTLGSGETVVSAIIFKNGGSNDTTSRLLFYVDFTDTATNGGTFTLNFNASGILYVNTAV